MKFIKLIGDLFFGKLFTLTMISIVLIFIKMLDSHMFIDGLSQFQMFTGLFLIIMGVLLTIVPKSPISDISKPWKIFNYSILIVAILSGIFLLKDYKERPFRHEELSELKVPTIAYTDKSVILEFPNSILHCDKVDVKFDSINPLKVYQSYKIDIFGKKSPCGICIKSDLMKNYAYPFVSR